jgi:hypothetical protein
MFLKKAYSVLVHSGYDWSCAVDVLGRPSALCKTEQARALSKVMSKAVLNLGNITGTLSIGTDFLAVGANSPQICLSHFKSRSSAGGPVSVSFREFVVKKLRR